MRHILHIILVPVLALICQSCEILETHPMEGIGSSVMWTTEEHAELGVTACYGILKQKGSYARNYMTDAYTPYAFIMSSGFDELGQRYFCYNTATTSYGVFDTKWQADYRGVQYANLALENIPRINMSEQKRDVYLAEVRFLRALFYFDLLTFYSGHKNEDKGIPIYTSMPDYTEAYLPRSTPADVRALMIEDLTFAIENLEFTSYEKGRVNRAAALMLLGKVYLYADNFIEAANVFKRLISENQQEGSPFGLAKNYGEMFTLNGEDNNEYIFIINNLATYGNGSYLDLLYSNRSANCAGTNTSIPTIYLADLYPNKDGSEFKWSDHAGFSWNDQKAVDKLFANRDPRLEATIIRPWALFVGKNSVTFQYRPKYDTNQSPYPCMRADNGLNDHYCWRKFINTGNETTIRRHSATDQPLMRWADVLLLYAEALNESEGPTQEVKDALKQIRSRVGMPAITYSDKSRMREAIRKERILELAGEGHLYGDWQRWYAHDPSFDYEQMNHVIYGYAGAPVGAKAGTRAFTSRNWYYAIPKADIELNPALTQGEGWDN